MANLVYSINIYGITAGSDLYSNVDLGIVDGDWSIKSHSNLLVKAGNSTATINISKGGNVASGYRFSFTLKNDDLAKLIFENALFFNGRKVQVVISVDGIDYNTWTGVIDTVKGESETGVLFECKDGILSNSVKMGSENVPIAFNRNLNCKLVAEDFNRDFLTLFRGNEYTYVDSVTVEANKITIPTDKGILDEYLSAQSLRIEVFLGGGSGKSYNILGFSKRESITVDYYTLYLDGEVDQIIKREAGVKEASLVRIMDFKTNLRVSNFPLYEIFDINSNAKKQLTAYADNDFSVNITNYDPYLSGAGVTLRGASSEDEVKLNDSFILDKSTIYAIQKSVFSNKNNLSLPRLVRLKLRLDLNKFDSIRIFKYIESGIDINIVAKNILFSVTNFGAPVNFLNFNKYSSELLTIPDFFKGMNNFVYSHSSFETTSDNYFFGSTSGNEVTLNIQSFFQGMPVEDDVKEMGEGLTTSIDFFIEVNISINTPQDTIEIIDYDITEPKVKLKGDFKYERLSVGCIGENVTNPEDISPTQTIEYIQSVYAGIDSADIDLTSYDNAFEEYYFYPNNFGAKNPAKQVIEQEGIIDNLKQLCFDYCLALFPSRAGLYTCRNWMWESVIYDNPVSPKKIFTNLNILSISDIVTDDINNIYTDFQIKYDFNESLGEYQGLLRIKGAENATFDIVRDSEGVSPQNEKIASDIHELAHAGYNRLNGNNQLILESKWFKSVYNPDFTDINNEAEALSFLAMLAPHVNRQHQYLTIKVPITAENLSIDLMDLVVVKDKIRTHNMERRAWVVWHNVDYENMTISFKLFLDISINDPYIVYIDILQDTAEYPDEIIDSATSLDILQDGKGVRV
jgi:hypothetical protein